MGNFIDRLRFGYVVDFLDFRVWPVFNIADCAISHRGSDISISNYISSGISKPFSKNRRKNLDKRHEFVIAKIIQKAIDIFLAENLCRNPGSFTKRNN